MKLHEFLDKTENMDKAAIELMEAFDKISEKYKFDLSEAYTCLGMFITKQLLSATEIGMVNHDPKTCVHCLENTPHCTGDMGNFH